MSATSRPECFRYQQQTEDQKGDAGADAVAFSGKGGTGPGTGLITSMSISRLVGYSLFATTNPPPNPATPSGQFVAPVGHPRSDAGRGQARRPPRIRAPERGRPQPREALAIGTSRAPGGERVRAGGHSRSGRSGALTAEPSPDRTVHAAVATIDGFEVEGERPEVARRSVSPKMTTPRIACGSPDVLGRPGVRSARSAATTAVPSLLVGTRRHPAVGEDVFVSHSGWLPGGRRRR